LRVETKG